MAYDDGMNSLPGTIGGGDKFGDGDPYGGDPYGGGQDPSAGSGMNWWEMPGDYSGYTTGQESDPANPNYSPAPDSGGNFFESVWEGIKRYGKGRAFGAVAQRAGDAAPLVGPLAAGMSAPEGRRGGAAFNSMIGQTVNGALYGINPALGAINTGIGLLTGKTLGSLFQTNGANPNGYTQNTAASGGDPSRSGAYGNMDNLITGLAGMYGANKANGALKNQINSLTGMYGQDSLYAQTLRSNLERQDARAGRRSQAGSREVQLQAKLAEMASRNSGAVANLQGQRNQNNMKKLNDLLYFGRSSGLFEGAQQGISNWMAQNNNPNYSNEGGNYPEPLIDYNQYSDQQWKHGFHWLQRRRR